MSERLTRQDMKRDEVQEWLGEAYLWITENVRTLLYAAAALVAAGLVTTVVMVYLDHREAKAQEVLAAALEIYQAPINPDGAAPDDPESPSFADEAARRARAKERFEEVRSSYGSTSAGQLAAVYLGRIAAAEGDLARARELWTGFLGREQGHAMAASVQLALYSLDRQEGRAQELVAELRRALEETRLVVPRDALLHELATTLEAEGETEESEQTFQQLIDEFPGSPYAAAARSRLGPTAAQFPLGT